MKLSTDNRRATVHDVAREAKVSLATVDRVLNKRPGVRKTTVERVEEAIETLGFQRDLGASLMARGRDFVVHFLIPDGANPFMHNLHAAVNALTPEALQSRIRIEVSRIPALDVSAQAKALRALDHDRCDCLVLVAADSPVLHDAIAVLRQRQISVITLVSDLPGSARQHFVGIDNLAAGRTAASLIGRFCRPGEKIGLLIGSLSLRDHLGRLEGFKTVIRQGFPKLELIGPFEGFDDPDLTEKASLSLINVAPDLNAIYSIGAGNEGLVRVLERLDAAKRPRVIAHEITNVTRKALETGLIDVVLDQNPIGEVRRVLTIAQDLARNGGETIADEPIEIGIFLRDNLSNAR